MATKKVEQQYYYVLVFLILRELNYMKPYSK